MSEHDITLTVNGEERSLTVEARTLLVHALRDELNYTGPKVGCEYGKCGACTVHLDGDAVKACTTLAVQADGGTVETVAGLGGDDLTSLQRAFHEEHGLQCGYCTPGMVMTASDLLADEPAPDDEEIRRALKGNICRCTGYQNVVSAVSRAAQKRSESVPESPTDAASTTPGEDD